MPSGKGPHQLRFGGWYSYREWAEHGFTPKSAHDRSAKPPEADIEPTADPAKPPPAIPQNPGKVADLPKDVVPPDGEHDNVPPHQRSGVAVPSARDLYPVPPSTGGPDKPLIRPYILTHGRTRPRHELAVHTLILTTERGRAATGGLLTEQDAICRMCDTARSVAEVAAMLKVPLGVARVVIDDMEYEGLIEIVAAYDSSRSVEVLTQVLEGLRRL
jgi:hypothetical protein